MATRLPIPTGLCNTAQGCASRATLGDSSALIPQPQRGCVTRGYKDRHNPVGVGANGYRLPRVTRASQPWAE